MGRIVGHDSGVSNVLNLIRNRMVKLYLEPQWPRSSGTDRSGIIVAFQFSKGDQ